jgi:hypothetical protein
MANTAPPIQPAGAAAGMNVKGMSHCKASAVSTASAHAIGGRTMTLAVSAVSLMARFVKPTLLAMRPIRRLLADVLEHMRDDAALGRIGQRSGEREIATLRRCGHQRFGRSTATNLRHFCCRGAWSGLFPIAASGADWSRRRIPPFADHKEAGYAI